MKYQQNMDLIRKIRLTKYRIQKYFQNKKFRKKLKIEKSKKYLFKSKPLEKMSIFSVYKWKKKFSQFVNITTNKIKTYKYSFYWVWLLLIFLVWYVIIISPYFRISYSKIIIERLDSITDINIAYKSVEKINWQPIFLLDKNELKSSIQNYQKNIKNISITRLYPNWLKIILDSYKPEFFTQFAWIEKKYIITSNWVLIYENNIDNMLYNLEIVDNYLIEVWFFDYKEWVKEESMKKIIYTRDLFKDAFINKNIAKFVYFKLENELHINLETWTKIILELNMDINKQLSMLKYYNDKNNDILSSWDITYIDIRNLWKIYICKEKILCYSNLVRIYPSFYKK